MKAKKFLSLGLCLTMMMAPLSIGANAEDTDPAYESTAETEDIASAAISFLNDVTLNTYQNEENDLAVHIADESDIAELDLEDAPSIQTFSAAGFSLDGNGELVEAEIAEAAEAVTEFSVDPGFSQYVNDKVEYMQMFNEAQNIVMNDLETDYEVLGLEIDGDSATLTIKEHLSFQYDDCDEPSSMGIVHNVSMINTDSGWAVTDDITDQPFDAANKDDGFNLEEALEEYDGTQATVYYSEDDIIDTEAEKQMQITPFAVLDRLAYDGYNAANYAKNFSGSSSSYYNRNFASYASSGGDCMNFASQSMWAGFSGSNTASDINNRRVPMDYDGVGAQYLWYAGNSSWISNSAFATYAVRSVHESPKTNHTTYNIYSGFTPSGSFANIPSYSTRLIGAVAQGSLQNHAVVITGVNGSTGGSIYVSSHTTDAKNVKLSGFFYNERVTIYAPIAFYTTRAADTGLRVRTNWNEPRTLNSTVSLTAYASQRSYKMSMSILTPSGKTVWIGEASNASSITKSYKFTERGLYHITGYARNVSESTPGSYSVGNTASLRIS